MSHTMLQICTKFSVHRVKKQKRKKTEVQAGSLYVLSVVNFTVSLDGELDLHSKRYCVSCGVGRVEGKGGLWSGGEG